MCCQGLATLETQRCKEALTLTALMKAFTVSLSTKLPLSRQGFDRSQNGLEGLSYYLSPDKNFGAFLLVLFIQLVESGGNSGTEGSLGSGWTRCFSFAHHPP